MPLKPSTKGPPPAHFVTVEKPLMGCVTNLARTLENVTAKWAIGGDAGEVISGVNVKPGRVTILTTAEGCDQICNLLVDCQTKAPGPCEVTLERQADVDGKLYPVRIRSRSAELTVDEMKVDVYGDLQIKVGDWDWGDPIDYDPTYVYFAKGKVPVLPLRLKSELYLGLGWMDRIELITVALTRAHMG